MWPAYCIPGHEIVHPDGAVHPAFDGLPSLRDAGDGHFRAVEGEEDEDAGLDFHPRLLHEFEPARHRRASLVAGHLEGGSASPLAEEIEAEGPEVPVRKGFEVDCRRVGLPIAFRPDPVVVETLGSYRRLMAGQIFARHEFGVAETLDSGEPLARTRRHGVDLPLRAGNVVGCLHETDTAVKHQDVGANAVLDPARGFLA